MHREASEPTIVHFQTCVCPFKINALSGTSVNHKSLKDDVDQFDMFCLLVCIGLGSLVFDAVLANLFNLLFQ